MKAIDDRNVYITIQSHSFASYGKKHAHARIHVSRNLFTLHFADGLSAPSGSNVARRLCQGPSPHRGLTLVNSGWNKALAPGIEKQEEGPSGIALATPEGMKGSGAQEFGGASSFGVQPNGSQVN